MLGILFVVTLLGIVFAPSIFVFGYIIKSLIDKKLSKKWADIASIYMVIIIVINILIIAIAAAGASAVPDEGGLIVIIFIFAILIELINLFILWLFYSLYYIRVNKGNSQVDNKKPLKKFITVILFLLIGLAIHCYISFTKENKNYLDVKKVNPQIIKVSNVNDILILNEYKIYNFDGKDVHNNAYNENLNGKKILIKGFPEILENDSIKNTVKLTIKNQIEPEDVIYDVYFSSEETFNENSFIYIYGTIKDSKHTPSDGYNNEENIINIIPDKIYYIEEKNYSLSIAHNYNGKWCLDEICLEFKIEDSILKQVDLISKTYTDSYVSFKQFPDNSIFIQSYDSIKAYVYLDGDNIRIEIIDSYSDCFKEGIYILTKEF